MSSNVHVFRKTADPSAAPTDVGQHWINTSSGGQWMSNGTASVANWIPWTADTGITQLTGDVTAGPGSGSQAATLAATIPNPHTWSGDQTFGANVNFTSHQNSSLTGSNVRIPSHPTSSVHFTNSSLVSIGSANNGGVSDGHCLFITNETGSTITIVNNYGGAAAGEKILTGSGANITIANGGSFALMYNATASLWNTFGGSVGVLAVTGTAPIASSGGSTPAISIATADTSTTGALTSTDWNTFNGKQAALGFTAENVANKDTDGTLAANSDTKYASQKATKTYVDTQNTPVISAIAASDIDWATLLKTGGLYTKTLAANTTFTFSNRTSGQTIVVRLTNTASNYTVTWPTVKWSGGAAPTMTVGVKSDIYTFIYDGTNVFGSFVQNMS